MAALAGVWRAIGERNLGLIAAGVAFYAMLSLFPATAAIIAMFGFFADPVFIESQMEFIREFVPQEAFVLLQGQLDRLISTTESTLGVTTLLSMLVALWSARLGVNGMIRGLTTMHGADHRGGVRDLFIAMLLTVVMIGVAIVSLLALLVFPVILAFIPLGGFESVLLNAVRWSVAIAAVVFGIALLYRFGPNRGGRRTPWISAGLIVAVLLWALASVAFSQFLANFGNYNEVYGSIGAVIALLMWLYISAFVVLLGGALNAELEALSVPTKDLSATQ